jgi:hypothetical protein
MKNEKWHLPFLVCFVGKKKCQVTVITAFGRLRYSGHKKATWYLVDSLVAGGNTVGTTRYFTLLYGTIHKYTNVL